MRCLRLATLRALLWSLVALAAPASGDPSGRPFAWGTSFPGGLVRVPLPAETRLVYQDATHRRPLMVRDGAAIAAVPLDTPGDSGRVYAETASGTYALPYPITQKAYAEQRLTLADPRQVDPNADDLRRIEREQVEIDAARDRFGAHVPATLDFVAPVAGPLSSPFGTRRVLNDKPRSRHNGLDFAAPTGAPIRAPKAGVVAAVGDWFFTGNTVIVDHGQGLTSMYCHLSSVAVKVGDQLAQGAPLGAVGATGRATGPHLHWAVYFANVPVDPRLLLRAE